MVQKEKLGREADGHPDLSAISKLFTDELAGTYMSNAEPKGDNQESSLEVCDTLAMSKKQMALLQNVRIKEKRSSLT